MAKVVGLLRFPAEWQGAINCSPQYFSSSSRGISSCAFRRGQGWMGGCTHFEQRSVPVCACHGFCSRHCTLGSQHVTEDQRWNSVLAPYVNVAVDSPWSSQVLSDCCRKLAALDPENGLGVLHGLLLSTDDATLLESFLELGVDADMLFMHAETKSYTGLPKLDLATTKKLNYGTPVHFAAFFGREKSLQALLDVGASLDAKTEGGEKPLDLAKDGCAKMIQDAVASGGAKTLAQLAKEGKYFAVRSKMRSGKVTTAELQIQCDGKTAAEWIWAKMTEWQFAMKMDQDSLVPFKVLAEMRYRYDVDAKSLGTPPAFNLATNSGLGNLAKLEELVMEESRKVRESQQTILESVCVLSGEMKNLKTIKTRVD